MCLCVSVNIFNLFLIVNVFFALKGSKLFIIIEYIRNQWVHRNKILSFIGVGERLHWVLGQIGSELLCPWQRIAPKGYNGENVLSTLAPSFLIRSSSYLQETRTFITSRTSSKFDQIGPRTAELAALERLKK